MTGGLLAGEAVVDEPEAFIERLRDLAAAHDCVVQALDGRYVACARQLERAVELAERSFARAENVADDPALEILLYAAGTRQIDRALELGVDAGTGPVAIVVVQAARFGIGDGDGGWDVDGDGNDDGNGDEADLKPGERVEVDRPNGALREVAAAIDVDGSIEVDDGPDAIGAAADPDRIDAFYAITPAELDATSADRCALVCERVALLEVEK